MKRNMNNKSDVADQKNKKFNHGKRGNNSKGKRYCKPEDRPSKSEELNINDSSFYYLDPTLRDQIMNFSFNQFIGYPDNFEVSDINGTQYIGTVTTPSLMAIYVNPSVNPCNTVYDGINIVGLRNFTLMSANNAKTTNYAPQDVTILMNALKSASDYVTYITRAFGVLYLYNQRNRSWPDTIYQAMFIDGDDFKKNAAAYRIRFNTIIQMFNQIPFFDNYGAFEKSKNMFQAIYCDDMSPMAQIYMFVPTSVWCFDETYDANGAGLRTYMNNVLETMAQKLDRLEALLAALLQSASLNFIYSDVKRILETGTGKEMHFDLVPENYIIPIAMNNEIESYIKNCVAMGTPRTNPSSSNYTPENDMSCDASINCIKYQPEFLFGATAGPLSLSSRYVDFRTPTPDVEERVNATRLASRAKFYFDSNTGYLASGNYIAFGDYYVTGINMYKNDQITPTAYTTQIQLASGTGVTISRMISIGSKFRYQPLSYLSTGNNANYIDEIYGDLNYYTELDFAYMRRMFDAEMIGEFSLRI